MGVVVLHKPDRAVDELPAVRDLLPQVDALLLVGNGTESQPSPLPLDGAGGRMRLLSFDANRGTAAAWNAALRLAAGNGYSFLYILDQDSAPSPAAVATAHAHIEAEGVAAVVQPPLPDRLGAVRFPWNTVASGSLYEVEALRRVGGFDERLFVDEVDHEVLHRLVTAGYGVKSLPRRSITHQVGSPRDVRVLGYTARVLDHGPERQRLRGYSTGQLVRRYMRVAPRISVGLVLREAVLATKEVAGGEAGAARSLLAGLLEGAATTRPPTRAADRACPYCGGPLLGRFADVPDWRFGYAPPGDVYRCAGCGALAAGRVPAGEEVARWYSDYYTHRAEPPPTRLWSRFWPTPARQEEIQRLHRYFVAPGVTGRLLDVGTGSGERLVEFAKAGWDVVGQDPDPKAGNLARDQGIEVHSCEVGELVGREEPFDLIGLTHVLEHAGDPAALLRACAQLLRPGGRLCVICPNAHGLGQLVFGRWWFGLEQPRHLGIPTLESLRRLTSQLGLQPLHAASVSTNAAALLGGSLARLVDERLPPGRLRRGAALSMHIVGQALGRGVTVVHDGLGEEVVWVGTAR